MYYSTEEKDSLSPTSEPEDPLHELSDIYGQTPPRTRYNRRQKERRQRTSWSESKSTSMKEARCKPILCRRNTLDTIIFDKMCGKADEDREKKSKEEAIKEGSRKCKRSLKLTRGVERDLKLDVETAREYSQNKNSNGITKLPNHIKLLSGIIETKNRFLCLRSKPVDVDQRKVETVQEEPAVVKAEENSTTSLENFGDRQLFHDTFSFLIRLGSTDRERNCRRQMSSEESRWQNELKDLIWLELQAFHADRTLVAQDEYLCKQREAVGCLLTEIIEYRYDPSSIPMDRRFSSGASDSGFSSSSSPAILESCSGCLSMYCRICLQSQTIALRQIEDLLSRLESAESLYPSSHAFGANYPLYKDPIFTGRIKAMCLWYNMTIHHRLKLRILSKLLIVLDNGKNPYIVDQTAATSPQQCSIKIDIFPEDSSVNSTPTSSTNSNTSSTSSSSRIIRKYSILPSPETSINNSDFYLMEFDRQIYRKYIEEVLKTRGLSKSLNFLERLHTSILRKASIALANHQDNDSSPEEYHGDAELKRYGMFSNEAISLNLPSYRSAFMFLSRVPLDVVHEFLRMRLEQKPEQPSVLSVRQLMGEMKEGLKIACIHRDRFIKHSKTTLINVDLDNLDIQDFDDSLQSVFKVYLDYLILWIEMMQFNGFNKNLIDDEWLFVKSIAKNIKQGHEIGGIKFCSIICMMIEQAKTFLITRPQEIQDSLDIIEDNNVSTRFQLMSVGREYQGMFVEAREKITKTLCMSKVLWKEIETWPTSPEIIDAIKSIKTKILSLGINIKNIIIQFQARVDETEEPMYENDRQAMKIRVREILHQAFKMGFDYYNGICKLFPQDERKLFIQYLVDFAKLWMDFVRSRCERGRGLRPRWANHGLEFLMTVCEPVNTRLLSDFEFEDLKSSMDHCISHVIGSNSSEDNLRRLPRSRGASPARLGVTTRMKEQFKSPEGSISQRKCSTVTLIVPDRNTTKQDRILDAIKKLDDDIDDKRRSDELIGRVTDRRRVDTVKIKIRRVTFTWQRGIKVGQGRFGKVYTVVNNQTGELLAMKEVPLQPGDHCGSIRKIAEELQIFEGIQHKHLVRYYGVEIQREEMLIFMEFCAEGTLESLVAGSGNGLPEIFVRKYTNQLLQAVSVLHSHGIVHRDIKTANIFLTDQANCLKLGDFGSAVQIRAHTTMPGELQGFVGTQAYMAPEIFMKTAGHGRAADIWSVGCCVVEMASGKRPWAEFDSNFQIMFKVGMGESPAAPKNLCNEGVDFIDKCLVHDSRERPTAGDLMDHPFARNYDDVNADLLTRTIC